MLWWKFLSRSCLRCCMGQREADEGGHFCHLDLIDALTHFQCQNIFCRRTGKHHCGRHSVVLSPPLFYLRFLSSLQFPVGFDSGCVPLSMASQASPSCHLITAWSHAWHINLLATKSDLGACHPNRLLDAILAQAMFTRTFCVS